MIKLSYPDSTANRYLVYNNTLFGPMTEQGADVTGAMSYRADSDSINERKAIYHENEVIHVTTDADVFISSKSGIITPNPTTTKPHAVTASLLSLAGPVSVPVVYGIAVDRSAYLVENSYTIIHQAYQKTLTGWKIWRISVPANLFTTVSKVEVWTFYKLGPVTTGNFVDVFYDLVQTTFPQQLYTTYDWRKEQSFTTITTLPLLGGTVYKKSGSTSGRLYSFLTELKPSEAKQDLDVFIDQLTNVSVRPHVKHFGDLAMEAAAKTVANHVNMIAFLRDLKNPAELVPKLKNLGKLKTLADNYLTVNYGILPTISDLKEIVGAMMKVKPYVDRNGFNTYSAGYRSEAFSEGILITNEQHIKLAIDKEDNVFEALIEKLDDIGALPTLENLWDLVPYSFVIDWFVQVGDLLERIDSRLRLARLNIRYVTMSQKTTYMGQIVGNAEQPLNGTVTQVHYHRWTSDQCPVPPLSLEPNPTEFNHWLESGALILQGAAK